MKDMNTGKCWHRWTIRTGVAAVALAVALPAVAQNYQQSRQQQRQSQQRDWDRQQNQRDSQQRQRQNRQGDQQSQLMHIDPQAWIRVGYDFNRDGRVDAVEDVFAFELQQAKVRSDEHRKRMQHDQQSRQGQQRADRERADRSRSSSHPSDMSPAVWDRQRQQRAMQQRSQNQQRSALRTVQGSVSSIHNQSISGHEHQHTLVMIDTQRGTARVDLGPKPNLKQLNIKEGDQIRVSGIRGTINGKQMLMAKRIQKRGGDSIFVDREKPIDARRFKGTIQDTRDVAFEQSDQEFMIAKVKLQNGKTTSVNLGPKSGLKNLSLSQGDEIRVLARPGQINGKMALIADEVWANNKNIAINQPQDRQRFQMAAQSQQSMQQRQQQQAKQQDRQNQSQQHRQGQQQSQQDLQSQQQRQQDQQQSQQDRQDQQQRQQAQQNQQQSQ